MLGWIPITRIACVLALGTFPSVVVSEVGLPVGRLEYADGRAFCTATLVAPDVLLTAAHCIAAHADRTSDEDPTFWFRPGGLRGTTPVGATAVVVHPLYDTENDPKQWMYRFDMAVAQLAESIPERIGSPVSIGTAAEEGEDLILVSWRGDLDTPRQRACPVFKGVRGLVTMGCSVQSGESGSAVLRAVDGALELVAVVSSRGQVLKQPIAQASDVVLRLPPLLHQLETMR